MLMAVMSCVMPVHAEDEVTVILTQQTGGDEEEDSDDDGSKKEPVTPPESKRRTPSAPMVCQIDFINNCLNGSTILNDVEEYAIWDETGTICICVLFDETSFVETLKEMPSSMTYLLVLRGSGFRLSGYFYNVSST